MAKRLFIVLGAGASYDCAGDPFHRPEPGGPLWRPPLVRQLFDSRFQEILAHYPMAQAAAADIVPLLDGDAFQIEKHIRTQYRESGHEIARRKYWSLPLYLQRVLFECATQFAFSPDAYDRLLTGLSTALDDWGWTFVTLNYDTLLDDRLAMLAPRRDMQWYVQPSRQWALIKLHGSVDWGRRVAEPALDSALGNPPLDLEDHLATEIELLTGAGGRVDRSALENLRRTTGRVFYPALSVPVGAADELVCPPPHMEALRGQLVDASPIHLLVIGYSGLDQEVVNVIRDTGDVNIRTLAVVDKGGGAQLALERILEALELQPTDLEFSRAYDMGFYQFAGGGNAPLREYLDGIRADG